MEPHPLDVTALVVERHPESLCLLEPILEPKGVILCDLVPPSDDGLWFYRRVRKDSDSRVPHIPAVVMTTVYEDITAAGASKLRELGGKVERA